MARKERNNIDYFPHSVSHGKKMFYLRSKYKNDGYAVWFMLLEELGKADYHYLDLKDNVQLMYLSASMMVSEQLLKEMINTLVEFGEFDKNLWEEESILFNEKFVDNISDAYKKRNNECVNQNSLLIHLRSIGRKKPPKRNPKQLKGDLEGDDNTQTILKNTKEEKKEIYSFDEFWNLYPKKIGKKTCLSKFSKLSNDSKQKIKDTLIDFINYKPFQSYTHPNPETYLNQERWNDELNNINREQPTIKLEVSNNKELYPVNPKHLPK